MTENVLEAIQRSEKLEPKLRAFVEFNRADALLVGTGESNTKSSNMLMLRSYKTPSYEAFFSKCFNSINRSIFSPRWQKSQQSATLKTNLYPSLMASPLG